MNEMSVYDTFVLNNIFEKFVGFHYPKELVRFIVMILYKIKISAGNQFTIVYNDSVYGSGLNNFGQLGLTTYRSKFMQKTPFRGMKKIICGGSYVIAINYHREVYAWGKNKCGQLGLGDTLNRKFPHKLCGISNVKKIACGTNHTIALTSDGKLYAWGHNNFGQLGIGNINNIQVPPYIYGTTVPHEINLQNVRSISCGDCHTVAITKDSELYMWGRNAKYELSIDADFQDSYVPEKFDLDGVQVQSASCGQDFTIALTIKGKLYSWGMNSVGQLGLGDTDFRTFGDKIQLENVKSVRSGGFHSVALTTDNTVYTWGSNQYGQLGLHDHNNRFVPCKVNLSFVSRIKCGRFHTIAIVNHTKVYTWGCNSKGQLCLSYIRGDTYIPRKIFPSYFH